MPVHFGPGERQFLADRREYGTVRRPNVLGLVRSPAVQLLMDDGTYRAYVGAYARKNAVDPAAKVNALGEPLDPSIVVPLDVKMVGWVYLSQMGVSAEDQERLFAAWRALPDAARQAATVTWDAVDKGDVGAVQAFVAGLMAQLTVPPADGG